MLMDAKKISEIIRAKKKKMMSAEPELVSTDIQPDLNPNDLADIKMDAEIEHSLDTPEKINGNVKALEVDDEMGLSEDEKKRMGRLRKYIDTLDVDDGSDI